MVAFVPFKHSWTIILTDFFRAKYHLLLRMWYKFVKMACNFTNEIKILWLIGKESLKNQSSSDPSGCTIYLNIKYEKKSNSLILSIL